MQIFHIAAAFFIALLSGLGIGGGGLFTVYLALVGGAPQLEAQGFNLIFFLFCSSASVAVQLWQRKVRFAPVVIMAIAGIGGSLLGVWATGVLAEELLRKIFGAMLVTGGIISLRSLLTEKSKPKNPLLFSRKK